jgi:RNA polymerase sigma factor (sigma-70 family)
MNEDAELLRRYVADHSEAAFAELVRRHVNLVYSAALRLVNGDSHRAEDVTQQVFAEVARQANRLVRHPALLGWLYTTTRQIALRALRTEQRRKAREHEANVMNEILHEPESECDWESLRSVLEDAMHELGEQERLGVLLRYFQNKTLKEVGLALGLNENAARMRVERALEKLRRALAREGVTSTVSGLALALTANAVTGAPSAFVATLVTTSLATAAAETGTAITLLKVMAMTKVQVGVTAIILAGATGSLFVQHQAQVRLREQNQALRQQIDRLQSDSESLSNHLREARLSPSPRLPAPALTASTPQAAREDLRSTNLYGRLKDYHAKLTSERIRPYLESNHRSASSLLAAYRSTGDLSLLEEASQKFPDDPQVAFEAMFKTNAVPEQRRQWLETLKRTAPDNSLANYLSALEYFKGGKTDQAVQELTAANGKPEFEDYTLERVQNDEDAYLAAGFSAAEAKTIPAQQLLLPQLAQMKELSAYLVDLSKSYRAAGDPTSAQAVLQLAANLGQRYSNVTAGEAEISQLVGMAVERIALGNMDPASPYGPSGQTVQDRMNQLAEQRSILEALNQQLEPLLPMMSDQDWISYKDRWRVFGEETAMRWVIGKYAQR